jgi:hypothetical protein
MLVDHGAAIVSWLSQMTPQQRRAAIQAEPTEHWPASLTRLYPGHNAVPSRDYEAALLAEAGYAISTQGWTGGGPGLADFAVYGVSAVLKSDTTSLVVIYTRPM